MEVTSIGILYMRENVQSAKMPTPTEMANHHAIPINNKIRSLSAIQLNGCVSPEMYGNVLFPITQISVTPDNRVTFNSRANEL